VGILYQIFYIFYELRLIASVRTRDQFISILQAKNILLRKENEILKRQIRRIQYSRRDKIFFLALLKRFREILRKSSILRPETVVNWHHQFAKRKWRFSQSRVGRPPLTNDLRDCVVDMKRANPRWGSLRISGELRKLGILLSKKTVSKILISNGFDPCVREYQIGARFM